MWGSNIHRGVYCLALSLVVFALPSAGLAQQAAESSPLRLTELALEFYDWLEVNAPVTPFSELRGPRPPGWAPDWTEEALQQRKVEYLQFQSRLKALGAAGDAAGDRVDEAILGAAIATIHWQLEVLPRPRRDPNFYLDQSLGSVFELLIQSPEPEERDVEELIRRLHRFPAVINAAKLGLDKTVPVLAQAAIERIGDVDARVDAMQSALDSYVSDRLRYDFNVGMRAARQSLTSYRDWLEVSFPQFNQPAAAGTQRYRWYLGHVALIPRTSDAVLTESELSLARSGAQIAVTRHRWPELPDPDQLANLDRLLQMTQISQQELRTFLAATNLVSLPAELSGIDVAALPPSLVPVSESGELIQFASDPGEITQRYMPDDAAAGGYLEGLAWADPRLLIAWDGIPGRHAQLWAASKHPRMVRRRSTGASLGSGLALYFHQQITESSLYSFKPASQLLALQVLQHRAALAQADIRLGSGSWGIEESVEFLIERGGLTRAQSMDAVYGLVAFPGRAGAAFAACGQLLRFLSDSMSALDETFSLLEFNDRLLMNANVPVALQRWEFLGTEDELDQLVEQRGRPATVPE